MKDPFANLSREMMNKMKSPLSRSMSMRHKMEQERFKALQKRERNLVRNLIKTRAEINILLGRKK